MPKNRESGLDLSIEELAAGETVVRALKLAESEAAWVTERHFEVTRIPAPTFGEGKRADYIQHQFRQLGLDRVRRDGAGNVIGEIHGTSRPRRYAIVSAHLDTVFPPGVPIEVRRGSPGNGTGGRDGRYYAPGITDNGAGLAALLGVARVMRGAGLRLRDSILFAANVCEEGEGNLYGMRHLLEPEEFRSHVQYVLVLDGANLEHITAHGVGSRRFRVRVEGPGGHSWNDSGLPSPICALSAAVTAFYATPLPAEPRTTLNVGQIEGGTGVNSVPASASMKVDIRSAASEEIRRVTLALEKAIRTAVEQENQRAPSGRLSYQIEDIGERPAASLPEAARILRAVQAVDHCLGIRSRIDRSSTDANIPLSLGIEALSLGGGGSGGAAHSQNEWYDPAGRELGVKRIVLALCALSDLA